MVDRNKIGDVRWNEFCIDGVEFGHQTTQIQMQCSINTKDNIQCQTRACKDSEAHEKESQNIRGPIIS